MGGVRVEAYIEFIVEAYKTGGSKISKMLKWKKYFTFIFHLMTNKMK